jgi:protein-disulfide isomerase
MTVFTTARRTALKAAVLGAALLALAACNKGGAGAGTDQDMTQGSPSAPVKVMEYASPSCPHCRRFNEEVFPAFKRKYVDTGKVEYIFRETPIHPQFDGPAFMLARCAPKDKYFSVIDQIMRGQDEYFNPAITSGPNADAQMTAAFRTVLMRTAQSVGLNEQQAMACMQNDEGLKKLSDRTDAETKQYDVQGTPTFIVDGKKVEPPAGAEPDLAWLDSVIQPELAKKKS